MKLSLSSTLGVSCRWRVCLLLKSDGGFSIGLCLVLRLSCGGCSSEAWRLQVMGFVRICRLWQGILLSCEAAPSLCVSSLVLVQTEKPSREWF